MNADPIYIFGAGGLGLEIKALLGRLPQWRLAGFYDDGHISNRTVHGLPVYGGIDALLEVRLHADVYVVIAIGDPVQKARVSTRLSQAKHIHYPVIIDPNAILLDVSSIKLGEGSIISAGCVLTANISIGRHTLINLNTTIGHDTVIGDHCSVMPGVNIAGNVSIEDVVLVGSGANVINSVTLGSHARIGAGAVVTKNVAPRKTVVGVPAREFPTS